MIVLYLNACPAGLRGDVTKWLMEVSAGIYVGNLSQRTREALWERVCKHTKNGSAVMVCSARNEQGFVFSTHNTSWNSRDFDGVFLMQRPIEKAERITGTFPDPDFANSVSGKQKAEKDISRTSDVKAKAFTEEQRKESSGAFTGNLRTEKKNQRQTRTKQIILPYFSWPEDQPLPNSFVALDTETTGLHPEADDIIEIGCIRIRERVVAEEFNCLIQCEKPLPEAIRNLTGITDQELAESGIKLEDALRQLTDFIGDDWIIGHNIKFDIDFLLNAYSATGTKSPAFKAIDTVLLSRKLLPDRVQNFRLETLANYFQITEKQSHRALPDACIVKDLYLKLNEN